MRILIVEDDENKRKRLVEFIASRFASQDLVEAGSLNSALGVLVDNPADLALLDMTIPSFDVTAEDDGGRPQAYGGREIMRHMEARGINARCIVVTQFESFGEGKNAMTAEALDALLRREHAGRYRGMVRYEAASEAWTEELASKILDIINEESK